MALWITSDSLNSLWRKMATNKPAFGCSLADEASEQLASSTLCGRQFLERLIADLARRTLELRAIGDTDSLSPNPLYAQLMQEVHQVTTVFSQVLKRILPDGQESPLELLQDHVEALSGKQRPLRRKNKPLEVAHLYHDDYDSDKEETLAFGCLLPVRVMPRERGVASLSAPTSLSSKTSTLEQISTLSSPASAPPITPPSALRRRGVRVAPRKVSWGDSQGMLPRPSPLSATGSMGASPASIWQELGVIDERGAYGLEEDRKDDSCEDRSSPLSIEQLQTQFPALSPFADERRSFLLPDLTGRQ